MFIKITTNKKGQSYYHLVESYRDQGKVRQRVLLSLGKVGEDRLDELISAIGRHKDVLTAIEVAKSLDIEDTYILGGVCTDAETIEEGMREMTLLKAL